MQTARYYITAFDLSDPAKTATTSIMMAKREFYVVPTRNPVETGEYIQLLGTAEGGAPDVHIEIQDMSGTILHVYDTSATNMGFFNYDFHIDMPPGDYPVVLTSATMKSSLPDNHPCYPPTDTNPVTDYRCWQLGPAGYYRPDICYDSCSPGQSGIPGNIRHTGSYQDHRTRIAFTSYHHSRYYHCRSRSVADTGTRAKDLIFFLPTSFVVSLKSRILRHLTITYIGL